MYDATELWLAGLGGAVAGAVLVLLGLRLMGRSLMAAAEKEGDSLREQARLDVETIRKEGALAAKDELLRAREEQDKVLEKQHRKHHCVEKCHRTQYCFIFTYNPLLSGTHHPGR